VVPGAGDIPSLTLVRVELATALYSQCHGDPNLDNVGNTPNEWYEESVERHGPVRRRLAEFKLAAAAAGPRGEISRDFRLFT